MTATEIRRDVEGYSDMTEDAFARRFYADRAELDSLGIHLTVDRPADGFSEQENYSLAPEAFFLPSIAFSDAELAALQTALSLLDGEFAYAEPLRLALQQLTWGRPSPLGSPAQRAIGLGITGSAGGAELSARLAKVDTAIYRRKRIEFEYFTIADGRDRRPQGRPVRAALRGRAVLPRRLVARARRDPRVPPLAHARQGGLRDQGRARLPAPGRLRPARVRQPHPVAARRPGRARPRSTSPSGSPGTWSATSAATARSPRPTTAARSSARSTRSRGSCSPGRSATSRTPTWLGPPELVEELGQRLERVAELHRGEPFTSVAAGRPPRDPEEEREAPRAPARARRDPPRALRPARHARLRAHPGRPPRRAARRSPT